MSIFNVASYASDICLFADSYYII